MTNNDAKRLAILVGGGPAPGINSVISAATIEARNAGLGRAAGEHVWFVDADDVVAPGGVGQVLRRLADSDPDVLLLGHARLRADGAVEATQGESRLPGGREMGDMPRIWRRSKGA